MMDNPSVSEQSRKSLRELIEKRDKIQSLKEAIEKRIANVSKEEQLEVEALSKRAIIRGARSTASTPNSFTRWLCLLSR
jgi:hypothetical protein